MNKNQEINGKLAEVTLGSSIWGLGGLVFGVYANSFIFNDIHIFPLIGIIGGLVVGVIVSLRKYNTNHSS